VKPQPTNNHDSELVTREEKKEISVRVGRLVEIKSQTYYKQTSRKGGFTPPKKPAKRSDFGQRALGLATITIWLILVGPILINLVDRLRDWYPGTLVAVYLGITLTPDQIILIADKILDVVINFGNKN
jgi:hypothetical protein